MAGSLPTSFGATADCGGSCWTPAASQELDADALPGPVEEEWRRRNELPVSLSTEDFLALATPETGQALAPVRLLSSSVGGGLSGVHSLDLGWLADSLVTGQEPMHSLAQQQAEEQGERVAMDATNPEPRVNHSTVRLSGGPPVNCIAQQPEAWQEHSPMLQNLPAQQPAPAAQLALLGRQGNTGAPAGTTLSSSRPPEGLKQPSLGKTRRTHTPPPGATGSSVASADGTNVTAEPGIEAWENDEGQYGRPPCKRLSVGPAEPAAAQQHQQQQQPCLGPEAGLTHGCGITAHAGKGYSALSAHCLDGQTLAAGSSYQQQASVYLTTAGHSVKAAGHAASLQPSWPDGFGAAVGPAVDVNPVPPIVITPCTPQPPLVPAAASGPAGKAHLGAKDQLVAAQQAQQACQVYGQQEALAAVMQAYMSASCVGSGGSPGAPMAMSAGGQPPVQSLGPVWESQPGWGPSPPAFAPLPASLRSAMPIQLHISTGPQLTLSTAPPVRLSQTASSITLSPGSPRSG